MEWAAQRIKDGYLYEWTVANCYSYVKTLIPTLPLQSKLKPNSSPAVGSVAIFDYSGTPHYAYVSDITKDGFKIKESNYIPATVGTRFIKWNQDKHLKGFWSPGTSP